MIILCFISLTVVCVYACTNGIWDGQTCVCDTGYYGGKCEYVNCVKGYPSPTSQGTCDCKPRYSGKLCDAATTLKQSATWTNVTTHKVVVGDPLPHASIHLPEFIANNFHYHQKTYIVASDHGTILIGPESVLSLQKGYCISHYSNTSLIIGYGSKLEISFDQNSANGQQPCALLDEQLLVNMNKTMTIVNVNVTEDEPEAEPGPELVQVDPNISNIFLGDHAQLSIANLDMMSQGCKIRLLDHSNLQAGGTNFVMLPNSDIFLGENNSFSAHLSVYVQKPGLLMEGAGRLHLGLDKWIDWREEFLPGFLQVEINDTDLEEPMEPKHYIENVRMNIGSSIVLSRLFMGSMSELSADTHSTVVMDNVKLRLEFNAKLLIGHGAKLLSGDLTKFIVDKDKILAIADYCTLEMRGFSQCSVLSFVTVTQTYLLIDRTTNITENADIICV